MKERILIVSFDVSHVTHNNRLARLLQKSFIVEHFSLLEPNSNTSKISFLRKYLSRVINSISSPTIGVLVLYQQIIGRIVLRNQSTNLLTKVIQDYFDDSGNFTSKVLSANRTLRFQKSLVLSSDRVIESAKKFNASCVLLPEDNHFYGTGIIVNRLHAIGVKAGVVDFTIGKESEFELSRELLVPDKFSRSYAIIAKLFLDSQAYTRWSQTKNFINCYPGSLETASYSCLNPSFESGSADFYLTSDEMEFAYLKRIAIRDSLVLVIEPIEVSLSRINHRNNATRNVFGLFLPPNQLSDSKVRERMLPNFPRNYEELILGVLDQIRGVCKESEDLVVFPHPRIYVSDPILLNSISKEFKVSDDFSEYLGTLGRALIFSSAVFSALMAANVKVFNLDLYNYSYEGVFPIGSNDFIEISEIKEVANFPVESKLQSLKSKRQLITVNEFLESYL
jgi:hypothetical protein